MGTALKDPPTELTIANLNEISVEDAFELTKEAIAELGKRYMVLGIEPDGTGREEVHKALQDCVKRRTSTKETGKQLREDANAFNKRVLGYEKEIIGALTPIESYLRDTRDKYDAEQARIKEEARRAALAILIGKVEALAAYGYHTTTHEVEAMDAAEYDEVLGTARLAHEEKLKAEVEARAEAERIAAEEKAERERLEAEAAAKRKAESERLKAEQEKLARNSARIAALHKVHHQCELADVEVMSDEEFELLLKTATRDHEAAIKRAADQRAEAEAEAKKLAEERAAIEAEKKRIADQEAAYQRKIETERREKEAAEKAKQEERDRIEREAAEAKAKAEREEAEAKRIEALRPDREKIEALADRIGTMDGPSFDNQKVAEEVEFILQDCCEQLRKMASELK